MERQESKRAPGPQGPQGEQGKPGKSPPPPRVIEPCYIIDGVIGKRYVGTVDCHSLDEEL